MFHNNKNNYQQKKIITFEKQKLHDFFKTPSCKRGMMFCVDYFPITVRAMPYSLLIHVPLFTFGYHINSMMCWLLKVGLGLIHI